MTSVTPTPPRFPHSDPEPARSRLRWTNWNLLLLVPLLGLFTPLYNHVEPRLFGMPFFYWSQLVGVFIGVGVTSVVYLMTRDELVFTDRPDRLNVDILDEGSR